MRRPFGWSSFAAASLFVIAVFVLWSFPPGEYAFYPSCPIHQYLHIECPGCGATRALSALLHGEVYAAIRLNALLVLGMLPLGLGYGAICFGRSLRREAFRWPTLPPQAVLAIWVVCAGFTVWRNV